MELQFTVKLLLKCYEVVRNAEIIEVTANANLQLIILR